MSMIDMGTKLSGTVGAQPAKEDKNKIYYPSFYIDKEIPIDEKDIGKEMMAICKIKLRSVSKRTDTKSSKYSCSFDIMGIDLMPKKKE